MKGHTKIQLNGKDIELKFNLGAIEDFQDYCEEKKIDPAIAESKMKHLRHLLHFMTGGKVSADEFRDLDISEVDKFKALVQKASGELGNASKAAKG